MSRDIVRAVSLDEEVAHVEKLIEDGRVEHLLTVCVEKGNPQPVHFQSGGASLVQSEKYLAIALAAVQRQLRSRN